jgi:carboxylesterase
MPMEPEASDTEVALLIHGLGGTRTDLGSLKRKLANDRLHAYDLMLPGHGGEPNDLLDVRAEAWLAAIDEKNRGVASGS